MFPEFHEKLPGENVRIFFKRYINPFKYLYCTLDAVLLFLNVAFENFPYLQILLVLDIT